MLFHPAMPCGTEEWHRSQRTTLAEGPDGSIWLLEDGESGGKLVKLIPAAGK